jgi:DNA-binding transcriptional MerR regulator
MSAAEKIDRDRWPYKMKDLCERTGLPRQVVHFYIQQGLVPEGKKTGRNMAYYGESHVERIRLVRELQEERFLPLKAIRAILRGDEEHFTPAQRALLVEVKDRLAGTLAKPAASRDTVLASELLARHGLTQRDVSQMIDVGLLAASPDGRGRTRIAREDAWMLELFGELRAIGFTEALGFEASDLAIFEEAVSTLVDRETTLLAERLEKLPADRIAAMVERALPLIGSFLARYHATKVRHFLAAL